VQLTNGGLAKIKKAKEIVYPMDEVDKQKFNPGSSEAIALGCICPVMDNHYGKGIDGNFWYTEYCPYHFSTVRIQKRFATPLPEGAVYCGRPSRLRNPYVMGKDHPKTGVPMTRNDVLELFEEYLSDKMQDEKFVSFLLSLRGKELACWCKLSEKCHVDIIIKFINELK